MNKRRVPFVRGMMARRLAVLALLSFATSQAVAYVDCCCRSFCPTPNQPCGDHEHGPRPAKDGC